MLEKDQGEVHISYVKMKVGDLVELKPRLDSANRQIDQLKSTKKQLLESLELFKTTTSSEKKDIQVIIDRLKVDEEKEKSEKKELASQVELLKKQVQEWSSVDAQTKQQKVGSCCARIFHLHLAPCTLHSHLHMFMITLFFFFIAPPGGA